MSTLTFVPFRREHYRWLSASEPNGGGMALPVEAFAEAEKHNCWTAAVDGEPIACGGTLQQWPGRHLAWAYMTPATRPHMLWLTRMAQQTLDEAEGRTEMTVHKDYEPGHRWAKMLGFEVETPMLRAFGPDGADHVGYVRFS